MAGLTISCQAYGTQSEKQAGKGGQVCKDLGNVRALSGISLILGHGRDALPRTHIMSTQELDINTI